MKRIKKEHLERLPVNENNITEVETWLQHMAARGYFLDETVGKWWYFKKREPKAVRYRLEIMEEKDGWFPPEKREDYENSGWQYVTAHGDRYHIFMSEEPQAEELHTDPIVRSIQISKYEKRMRRNFAMPFVLVLNYYFCIRRFLLEGWRNPVLWTVSSDMPLFLMMTVISVYVIVRSIRDVQTVRRLRKTLEQGEDVLPEEKEERHYSAAAGYAILGVFVLTAFFFLRSLGEGGPIEQQLGYGEKFPALQFLEEGEIRPVVDEESEEPGLFGGSSGTVYHYKNLLLKEHLTVEQEARILPHGAEADEEGSTARLYAEVYETRFAFLAPHISRELKANCPDLTFYSLPQEEFEEYYLAVKDTSEGKEQTLIARRGTCVWMLRYRGQEDLAEKAETLRTALE